MKVLKPFMFIVALVLIVGMACSFGGSTTTPPTEAPQVEEPTNAPEPTQEPEPTTPPEPTEVPTEEATPTEEPPAAADFYREEFEGDISNYSYFEWHEEYQSKPEDKDIVPTTKDGYLVFDLSKTNKWVYVTYDAYTYTDTRIDIKADNRGKNNNNVSLICRYSDEGWYELNIANNGLYSLLVYIEADGQYYTIANGGSTQIKQGKGTNEYTFICNGEELTAGINGYEVKTITDTKYKLREGQVGFGVSSFDVTPILVEVDYFDISQP